jgi:hypothetical protein
LYWRGPDRTPPSDMFVNWVPTAWAARSVHSSPGVLYTKLVPRMRKFEPDPGRMLKFAPLNPPLEASYGEVVSDVWTCASRGRVALLNGRPLRVVLF